MRKICDGAVFDFSILAIGFPQEIAGVFASAVCFSDIHSVYYNNHHSGYVNNKIIKKQKYYWLHILPKNCPNLSCKGKLAKNDGWNIRYSMKMKGDFPYMLLEELVVEIILRKDHEYGFI